LLIRIWSQSEFFKGLKLKSLKYVKGLNGMKATSTKMHRFGLKVFVAAMIFPEQ
jgi:hypothetical protein